MILVKGHVLCLRKKSASQVSSICEPESNQAVALLVLQYDREQVHGEEFKAGIRSGHWHERLLDSVTIRLQPSHIDLYLFFDLIFKLDRTRFFFIAGTALFSCRKRHLNVWSRK